jgi:hypothetical protein
MSSALDTGAMNEYFIHHAYFAVQQVRNGTSGYGPPRHDPLSRRPKSRPTPRPARRPVRVRLATLRVPRVERRTVARAPR